jgi:hypothetical protein
VLRFNETADLWIVHAGAGRSMRVPVEQATAVMEALGREWLSQLVRLGFVVADATICARTALAEWLEHDVALPQVASPLRSVDARTLLVEPLAVDPVALQQIALASRLLPPQAAYARYEIVPQGVARLLEADVSVADFERTLLDAGAQLAPEFRKQLIEWAGRAGRVRLHRPLTVLVTPEDAPLPQIVAAAGLSEVAEVLGPGCVVIDPEYAEAAIQQLRARGFWPRELKP